MVSGIRKKIAGTIPFGYKTGKDPKLLYPINSELKILEKTLNEIRKGELSLRKASKSIKSQTKRNLSHPALLKIMNERFQNWQEKANIEKLKIKNKKIKFKLFIKSKIREKKIKEKMRIRELKKIKYWKCKVCEEKKLRSEFLRNKTKYCNNCKLMILNKDPNLFLRCRICNQKKSFIEFAGKDGHNIYKSRTCYPCFRNYHRLWDIKNKTKRLKINRKSRLYSDTDIKRNKTLW